MVVLLDDHLLRDLLADHLSTELAEILGEHEPATTNLYLYQGSGIAASAGKSPVRLVGTGS